VSDAVLVAIVGGAFALATTVLQLVARSQIRAVRDQLENDHARDPHKTTNLRDDLDRKHDELVRIVRNQSKDIGGIRGDIRQLRSDLSHESERIDEIERTREPLSRQERTPWANTPQ
jgi:septal ring factor EnvC (AmiA/AmiB activator)